MRLDAEWYDFRDLGNCVGALQEQFEDWGAPDWVPYVTGGVIGVVAILLWTCSACWRSSGSSGGSSG